MVFGLVLPSTHTTCIICIFLIQLTICSCHVMYAFQSESTLYTCLDVKELLARSRCKVWSLSDCNWTGTQNHLTRQIIELCSAFLYCAFDCMFLSCHVRLSEWILTLYLPECQGTPFSKKARSLRFKWLKLDWNPEPLTSQTNTQPFGQLWPNGWVFVYELSASGFQFRCIHLNF